MASSVPEFTDRPSLKLYTAKQHFDRLRDLHNTKGSIVASEARLQAEIEIDEFFYQLVSAKDALLREINKKLRLGISLKDVDGGEVNSRLKLISREHIMAEINQMNNKDNWLWLVNEFHNISKHRELIGKDIVAVVPPGKITKVALRHPETDKPMEQDVFDYLSECLKLIEGLVAVRKKIS
jgi:hypothetical protein